MKLALLFILIYSAINFAQTPFITHMYTVDPTARVFNDTLYVYPLHDDDTASWFWMKDWHVIIQLHVK